MPCRGESWRWKRWTVKKLSWTPLYQPFTSSNRITIIMPIMIHPHWIFLPLSFFFFFFLHTSPIHKWCGCLILTTVRSKTLLLKKCEELRLVFLHISSAVLSAELLAILKVMFPCKCLYYEAWQRKKCILSQNSWPCILKYHSHKGSSVKCPIKSSSLFPRQWKIVPHSRVHFLVSCPIWF